MPDLTPYRRLFPNIFSRDSKGNSARAYENAVNKALNYVNTDFHDWQRKSKEEYNKYLDNIQEQLVSAWEAGEKTLSKEILDGTVDSFPSSWVTNGEQVNFTRTTTTEDEDSVNKETTELIPIDIGVEYSVCARTAMEKAEKTYTPYRYEKKTVKSPGEGSVIYDTFKHLYAYKKEKESWSHSINIFTILIAEFLIIAGYIYWSSHAHPPFLVHLLIYITSLVTLFTIWFFISDLRQNFYWLFHHRQIKRSILAMGKTKLKDAEKLLAYQKLWRIVLKQAAENGYTYKIYNGKGMWTGPLGINDWVIEHMENLISFVRSN